MTADVCPSTRIDPDTLNSLFKGSNRDLVPKLLEVIWNLQRYWPMTLRQIYYQAVANLLVSNNESQYRRIMNILKKLREEDVLPYSAMEDRARRTSDKRGVEGLQVFLKENLALALNWRYYHRCHLQGQGVYVEVTVEKDALAPLIEDVTSRLCTRMSVTKGQPSVTLMEQIAGRMDQAMQRGQDPILLHFGDLDPTGVQVPISMRDTLYKVHGLDVEVITGALTPQQCSFNSLPQSLDAAKSDDPNYSRWIAKYAGQAPTELDAMHPEILQQTVKEALLNLYDQDLINEQIDKEYADEDLLKEMRNSMLKHLLAEFPSVMEQVDLDWR